MNILTTNKIQRFMTVLVLMLVGFSSGIAHAKNYCPVDIQPYDEQSKKILENELEHFSSSFSILQNQETNSFAKAFNNYKANPTEENYAIVVKRTEKAINTNMVLLSKSEAVLGRAITEILKYKEHLRKMIRSMKNQNTSLSGETKWAKAEVRALESSLNEMEESRKDLKKMKQDYAAISSAWIKRKEIEQFIEAIHETTDCVYDTGSFLLGSDHPTLKK